jgi:hypothetical protein
MCHLLRCHAQETEAGRLWSCLKREAKNREDACRVFVDQASETVSADPDAKHENLWAAS